MTYPTVSLSIPQLVVPPPRTYTDAYKYAILYSDRSGIIALVRSQDCAREMARGVTPYMKRCGLDAPVIINIDSGELTAVDDG